MLCKYAILNRKTNHLKFYIYLKVMASGHLKYDNSSYSAWASDICMSERWTKNTFKWFIKKGWVTINNKQKSLRVIGYKQLVRITNIEQCQSAVIWEEDDFENFKAFCCAGIITYYMNRKRFSDRKRLPVSIMGGTNTSSNSYPKGYYEMPLEYLASCLDVSKSSAYNFKAKAIDGKFIKRKRRIEFVTDSDGNKLPREAYEVYLKNYPEFAQRLRRGKLYLKIVFPDLLYSSLKTKRKRLKV
jgi:hypothetical protein